MFKRSLITLVMVAIPLTLIGYGLYVLFSLRLETGDVFPPASTLRADPLGARILYESLGRLPGLDVERNYAPLTRRQGERGTVYVFLGVDAFWIPESFRRDISRLMLEGSRIVISFSHERRYERDRDEEESAAATTNLTCDAGMGANTNGGGTCSSFWINDHRLWGASMEIRGRALSVTGAVPLAALAPGNDDKGLGPVSWPTALFFEPLDRHWQALLVRDGHPVLMERDFGQGSVVLVADSYFLSNEAMLKERHSRLIGLLVGSSRRLVFDESHLGVRDERGVMMLVWKYRMFGPVAALLLLAGLFLWSALIPILPAYGDATDTEDVVTGMDARRGYIHLLKRNIGAADALAVCVAEWEKSGGRQARPGPRVERVRAALAAFQAAPHGDPVQTYRLICRCIKESGRT